MRNSLFRDKSTSRFEAAHRVRVGTPEEVPASMPDILRILAAQHFLRGWAGPGLANSEAASAPPGPWKLGAVPKQEAADPTLFPASHSGTF